MHKGGFLCRSQHIFDKNPIPRGGVADQHVRDRADKPPVLNDRAAAHALYDAAGSLELLRALTRGLQMEQAPLRGLAFAVSE